MSFGSDIGSYLTSSDKFEAHLIIEGEEPTPINFDTYEVSYIEGFQFFIRLGLEDNPGSKNELTLEARELKTGQTYPIGPQAPGIKASFGLEGYVEYFPADYSGFLTVERIERSDVGNTTLSLRFSIYFKPDGKPEMEVSCQTLELSAFAAGGTPVGGTFEKASKGSTEAALAPIPTFCEIAVRVNGGYEVIDLGNIYFVRYPDLSFFIQCTPRNGSTRATLEFRGDELKAYTNYPITGIDGRKRQAGSVDTFFILRPEFSGSFSDPTGEFRVLRTHDSEEGFWCQCEFEFSVTAGGSEYKVESLVFQIQVSEANA
ncbi:MULTISPECIES: hypothetical protein [Pseudomonas]|jgi:hypothetical protein|uniref:Uncharacterized protein n=1 Tax=Pseudomonas sivasensis TaxID=1880678 RepID=A0ABW8E566_9PSED|nr:MULTISPECIES: hypothetical protein [Pseudomonas]EZP65268.1 hypothetical protein BW43_03530 [Pseudomonas sp. RIT357]MBA2932390.1 hypothetical protein [Pseudomonas sivasensis]MCT4497428.1 hypothetical protein [Pseudomonas sivasensis]